MSKRILQIGLLAMVVISLTGCLGDKSSDEFEEDVQSLEGPINNNDPDRYRGRVMNGELESALVWLDMDGDGVFESDEPGVLSDADGRFELDVSGLQRDRTDSVDLDPRDFPLMAVAIPGLTENTRTGQIDRAFFLAAPPGVELVTPFTTMAETWRRLQGIEDPRQGVSEAGTEVTRRVSVADEAIGVYSDYLISGAERVPFYAEAFRRMIQAQIRDSLNTAIAGGASADSVEDLADSEIIGIPGDQIDVIGSILLDQSEPLINEVDETIEMSGGVDGFQLPDLETVTTVGADLDNPWLVRQQTLYLPGNGEEDFNNDAIPEDFRRAGIITHDYSVGTTLRRATSRGYFAPSMQSVIRMANEYGRVTNLGAQLGLEFDLENAIEGSVDAQDSPHERFIFDWSRSGDLARLQSLRSENVSLGSLAEYGRQDADWVYRSVSEEDEVVTKVERLDGVNGEDNLHITESDQAPEIGGRRVYSSLNLSTGDEVVRRVGDFSFCPDIESESDVNAKQVIEVLDGDDNLLGTEAFYGHLRDGETPVFRVLIHDFDAAGSEPDNNWRWEYQYFDDPDSNGTGLPGDQQDLVDALVWTEGEESLQGSEDPCDVSNSTQNIDAFIEFEYIRFAQYLEEIGTRN